MSITKWLFVAVMLAGCAHAGTVSFEGDSFPEDVGWSRIERLYPAGRSLDSGVFVQAPSVIDVNGFAVGQSGFYTRGLHDFANSATFFAEWRVETTGLREEMFNVDSFVKTPVSRKSPTLTLAQGPVFRAISTFYE